MIAILIAMALPLAATVALGAFAGAGMWMVTVLGAGMLGILATLTAVGISAAAGDAPTRRAPVDRITGLPDGEMLRSELRHALSSGQRESHLLCLFALDGLKLYYDAYGEACADALLAWLGRKLRDAVAARGTVYRMRSGSFAVLTSGPPEATVKVRADASASLFEVGDGFVIWSSVAAVSLPEQAQTVEEALEIADRTARAEHEHPRADAELHPPDDPSEVTNDAGSSYDVGELARRVGRRMGIQAQALDDLEAAARLRDIGNVAIPSAVLALAGELPGQEWEFIRLHTVVGARLLAARMGMDQVARIVHSSHERWDGSGYPDELRGEAIPPAARIVFACGAFVDMTSARPHRPALGAEAALAELDACAGGQFDPHVVRAFREAFAAEHDLVGSARALHARRPLRVLLAQPDPVARFLLGRAIAAAGHECLTVTSGLAAWARYQESSPDVVIAGEKLDELGGIELCRRARAQERGHAYRVVLTDSEDRDRLRREARGTADEVLATPVERIDLEVLLSKAGNLLARGQASAA